MKSDIYRDKIVNTYIKRKEVHEKFVQEKGIITPIRAYDFNVQADDASTMMTKAFKEFAKIIETFNVKDEVEKFKLLKAYCNPIGYFVARPTDGNTYIRFGLSVCSVLDDFNKDRGLLMAFGKNYALPGIGQIPANKVEVFPEDKWFERFKKDTKIKVEFDWYSEGKIRYWPISFKDQYKLFKKRCSVYYKNIVK